MMHIHANIAPGSIATCIAKPDSVLSGVSMKFGGMDVLRLRFSINAIRNAIRHRNQLSRVCASFDTHMISNLPKIMSSCAVDSRDVKVPTGASA